MYLSFLQVVQLVVEGSYVVEYLWWNVCSDLVSENVASLLVSL